MPFVSSSIHVSENDENAHNNSASRVVNISDTSLVIFQAELISCRDLWSVKSKMEWFPKICRDAAHLARWHGT